MLNTFPGLLLPFLAPLIVRAAVGLVFVGLSVRTWRRAGELASVPLPLVGAQIWLPYLAAVAELALGLMFIAGWYTQIAALLGLVGKLKYAVYRRWWPHVAAGYAPLSPLAAALVAVMCLSLLVSGAGALAQDLPL